MNFLRLPFMNKSYGWNRCVTLIRTFTKYTLFYVKCQETSCVIWPQNTSNRSKAVWLVFPRIWHSASTYIQNYNFVNNLYWFKCVAEVLEIHTLRKRFKPWKALICSPVIHELHQQEISFQWNHKCSYDTSLINRTCDYTLSLTSPRYGLHLAYTWDAFDQDSWQGYLKYYVLQQVIKYNDFV